MITSWLASLGAPDNILWATSLPDHYDPVLDQSVDIKYNALHFKLETCVTEDIRQSKHEAVTLLKWPDIERY